MQNKKFGAFSSSDDPQKLADTVKSFILALASVIIILGRQFGWEITQENIVLVAGQLGLAVSSIWFIFGLVKKVVVHFTQK
jgi:alanine-alpha-ketoisovalerate/valine-pyruvate aminotransferase